MKDDLQLRPIYHQLEERIEAHIFVAFLAYCLHVTLRARLKPLAGGLTPRAVLDKLAAVQMLDVNFPTTDGRTLVMRRYTELGPSKSSWSSNSSSICRRNHHQVSNSTLRRLELSGRLRPIKPTGSLSGKTFYSDENIREVAGGEGGTETPPGHAPRQGESRADLSSNGTSQ